MKVLREEDSILSRVKRIHMIGIGGSGMCPLAQILHHKGYSLTGSDHNESDPLARVRALGIPVYMGHAAEQVEGAELVVYSAAISSDNPELVAAREKGIPTMERSHLLGAMTRWYDDVIGVCGTHGKTTVTSMITQILLLNGLDPTAVIGGKLPLINANGRVGATEHMVCESCEFVDTFLQMSPDTAVLLNVDNDHLNYFKTMDNLVASFHKFLAMSRKAYYNGDDPLCCKAASGIHASTVTFGLADTNDYYAAGLIAGKKGYGFDVFHAGKPVGHVDLSIPGKHNVYNGLAAFVTCLEMGVPAEGIVRALADFTGAGRRFEFIGTFGKGFTLADDYAHHPTEIEATLSAAKELDYQRVICVFQPFTFSRTALLFDAFVSALSLADRVILTPIMGSREINTYGVTSEQLAEKMPNATVNDQGFRAVAEQLLAECRAGDLVITMGGGDIYKVCHILEEDGQ